MVKLREQADVVEITIVNRISDAFEYMWVITDVDLGGALDSIDSEEFIEALSLLSIEG